MTCTCLFVRPGHGDSGSAAMCILCVTRAVRFESLGVRAVILPRFATLLVSGLGIVLAVCALILIVLSWFFLDVCASLSIVRAYVMILC